MSSLNERQLVALVKEHLPYDTTLFQQLITPYFPKLKGYCYQMLKDHSDAEDVVQEVLIKVLVNLKSFKWLVSFNAWLFRIAHNECINKIRERRWDVFESNEDYIEQLEIEQLETNNAQEEDFSQLLTTLLDKLSLIDRNIMLLRYRSDLGFQEIADICDMKISAVKMRHKRVISLLSKSSQ